MNFCYHFYRNEHLGRRKCNFIMENTQNSSFTCRFFFEESKTLRQQQQLNNKASLRPDWHLLRYRYTLSVRSPVRRLHAKQNNKMGHHVIWKCNLLNILLNFNGHHCKVELFGGFEPRQQQQKKKIFLYHTTLMSTPSLHMMYMTRNDGADRTRCVCVWSARKSFCPWAERAPGSFSRPCDLSVPPLSCRSIPSLSVSSSLLSSSDPFIPPSRALPLLCPRRCRPAGFDQGAREERGSGSESCAGDCRRTRLEYRVGEAGRGSEGEMG